jgi:hypothetical protein
MTEPFGHSDVIAGLGNLDDPANIGGPLDWPISPITLISF